MNILFIPVTDSNPYQSRLKEALSRQGVKVVGKIGFSPFCFICSYLSHLMKFGKPDVVHIHWLHSFLNGLAKPATVLKSIIFLLELKIIKTTGVKIVWTVHNIISHESNYKSSELYFTSKIVGLCDHLIAHTGSTKQAILQAYPHAAGKISVVPHGHYINAYNDTIGPAAARIELGIHESDKVILYFGRIRPYKGLDELLEAFYRLDRNDVTLVIAGTPESAYIKSKLLKAAQVDNRIKLELTFIPDDRIQVFMNAADVVVLPFRNILNSGTAILAMSYRKPVVAPALGGLVDILDEQGSILYDPDEDHALAESLARILHMDTDKMGQHNYQLARTFDWDNIADRTRAVYLSCLTGFT